MVFEYTMQVGTIACGKTEVGEAKFHQWGMDYEEFETGPGNFSVAIIEFQDGSVQTVSPELIKFID